MQRFSGFTLIELVVVIMVLSVVGIMTTRYLAFGGEIYVDAKARQEAVNSVRYAAERMRREVHNALPNSIRISADTANDRQCVEFVPTVDSGVYQSLPQLTTETTMDVIMLDGSAISANDYIWVYATKADHIYDLSSGRIGTVNSISNPSPNQYKITFTAAPKFKKTSPVGRFYAGNTAVSYCVRNGNLYRHSGYSFTDSQILFTSGGVLMAEGLINDVQLAPPFSYNGVAASRYSQLLLDWRLITKSGEPLEIYHALHIANVP